MNNIAYGGRPLLWASRALVLGLWGVAVAWLVGRVFLFDFYRVPSASMMPSYPKGSYIVTSDLGYGRVDFGGAKLYQGKTDPALMQAGEVYTFLQPATESIYVKRLVGLPGDEIEIGTKGVFVNGQALRTGQLSQVKNSNGSDAMVSFVTEKLGQKEYQIQLENRHFALGYDRKVTVPEGHYYFLGDNRHNSSDSRVWGFVPAANISGRVVVTF